MNLSDLLSEIEIILEEIYKTPDLGNKVDILDEIVYLNLCIKSGPTNVNKAYSELKANFPNWKDVFGVESGNIAYHIRVSGNAGRKAKNIKDILDYIDEKIGDDNLDFLRGYSDEGARQWLEAVPNVGSKIANCVLLFCLDRDVFPVDTHIERILKRLNIVPSKTKPSVITLEIQEHIPKGKSKSLHVNLIEHGREICRAISPKCEQCQISKYCAYAGNHVLGS